MYYFDEEKHMDHQCTFIWEEYVPGGCHWRYRGRESLLDSSGAIKTPDLVISFIRASYGFFRLGRWPERTWQARTSQITRVEIRLVISAAS